MSEKPSDRVIPRSTLLGYQAEFLDQRIIPIARNELGGCTRIAAVIERVQRVVIEQEGRLIVVAQVMVLGERTR